ncbi:tyrosine-type recombinase/integrase [Olsenella sp. HMSC062G07]|uniref:tyrosine-type recombinase/integrase n=1 Tax=Olsenella sp. HMSC062G07 TaxID=1739330 RepID=UPI0008A11050|nr:tyrosine-type recombinase/integrase [Olsenella sp. HMSC062G07]OFK23298.1 hypothetical protein HMPREF2826_05135 [Olsenella sp. HMSC062G07]
MRYSTATVKQTANGKKWRGILRYKQPTGELDAGGKPVEKWAELTKTLSATTKTEAKRELARWRADMEEQAEKDAKRGPVAVKSSKTPVADYVDAYISNAEAAKTIEASSVRGYRGSAKYIREGLGSITMEALKPEHVQALESDLIARGLSSSTVGKVHRLLKMVMNDAVNKRVVDFNPVDPVKPPKRVKTNPGINALDGAGRIEVLSKLDALGYTPVTVGARIALFTGLREAEICALQWRDIDFVNGVLWVRRNIGLGKGGAYVKLAKTDKVRDVALPAELADVLRAWRGVQMEKFAEADTRFSENAFVLGDAVGFLHPATLGRGWAALAEAFGVKGTEGRIPTFHDLRHSWATLYLAAGGDVKTAASNLGHANASMTLNVYASADPDAKRRAAEITQEAMRPNLAEIVPMRCTGTEG